MKFLLEEQISSFLRPDKSIEQYIGKNDHGDYSTIRWIGIGRTKDSYTIVFHEVFDEADEIESIYDFPYVEPDDMYEKEIEEFDSIQDALEFAENNYGAKIDKYLPFGFLDEYIIIFDK